MSVPVVCVANNALYMLHLLLGQAHSPSVVVVPVNLTRRCKQRPRQQQPLLAHVGEADGGLGPVAAALDVDDHAVAEGGVVDVVADLGDDAGRH